MPNFKTNNNDPARGPYRLSNSNIIFLSCFLAVYGLTFAAYLPTLTRDGRTYWIARIVTVAVTPLVVSFVTWLTSKRSRRASSTAFNAVLGWFLFLRILQLIGTVSGE